VLVWASLGLLPCLIPRRSGASCRQLEMASAHLHVVVWSVLSPDARIKTWIKTDASVFRHPQVRCWSDRFSDCCPPTAGRRGRIHEGDDAVCGELWRHSKFVSGVRLAVRTAIICIIFSQHASGVCFPFNNHRPSQSCGSLASSPTNVKVTLPSLLGCLRRIRSRAANLYEAREKVLPRRGWWPYEEL
jgi:hypothetical protein